MDFVAASSDGHPVMAVPVRVRDVVRDVVAGTAPEELPVVDGLTRFDDGTVVWRLRRWRARPEPLGFGLGDVVVLVTPLVWLVLDQVAQQAVGATVDGVAGRLKALARRIRHRRPAPVAVPPLTRAQLREVRHRVMEAAAAQGVAGERAAAIADAVVARLVLAPPRDSDC